LYVQMKSLCLQREDADARMQSSQNFSKGRLKVEIDMKFALKTLAIASAMIAAGAANAAAVTGQVGVGVTVADPAGSGRSATLTLLTGSSGALSFSNGGWQPGDDVGNIGGLIGALNVGKVAISGVGGVTTETIEYTDPDYGDVYRVGSIATAQVTSLTADNVTGQVLSVQSAGGAVQTGTRINGVLTGGVASVTNLKFDLANKVVIADLTGTKSAVGTNAAVNYNLGTTTLWNIATITGPTVIPPSALLAADPVAAMTAAGFSNVVKLTDAQGDYYTGEANNVISGLSITQAGFDFFKNSLGLGATGLSALSAVTDYGSVTSNLKFSVREVTPAVPEPSTYAMMAIGLVGLGFAARRRAK